MSTCISWSMLPSLLKRLSTLALSRTATGSFLSFGEEGAQGRLPGCCTLQRPFFPHRNEKLCRKERLSCLPLLYLYLCASPAPAPQNPKIKSTHTPATYNALSPFIPASSPALSRPLGGPRWPLRAAQLSTSVGFPLLSVFCLSLPRLSFSFHRHLFFVSHYHSRHNQTTGSRRYSPAHTS